MAADKSEPDGFLASIEAKIAALQALADSYRAALSLGALGQPGDVDMATYSPPVTRGTPQTGPVEMPKGAFRGMGIAQAIRAYLEAAQRRQAQKEIVAALREGGVVSTSPDFEKMVSSTLHRLRHAGELLQFSDGWDLASGYSEAFRQRLKESSQKSKVAKPEAAAKPRRTRGASKLKPVLPLTDAQDRAS